MQQQEAMGVLGWQAAHGAGEFGALVVRRGSGEVGGDGAVFEWAPRDGEGMLELCYAGV